MIHAARALDLRVMLGCMVSSELGIAQAAQLASLADHVDLDGHLLLTESPFVGLGLEDGRIVLSDQPEGALTFYFRSTERLDEAELQFKAADSSFEQLSSVSHRAAAWVALGDLSTRRRDDRAAAQARAHAGRGDQPTGRRRRRRARVITSTEPRSTWSARSRRRARPPPTKLSAPASNRAVTSPVSDSTPQAPCDLSSKGGLLLLRVSSIS